MERDVLDDAVALVEDPEHRDALRHRSHPALPGRGRWRLFCRARGVLLFAALAARNERERNQERCGNLVHAYSGVHGS
jgi:hypothetical protein